MDISKFLILKKSKLVGEITPPPSKSILHRYIIASSFCDEKILIKNINLSEDIIATIEAMRILGTSINIKDNELLIDGSSLFSNLKNTEINKKTVINCNESGSTLRFIIPVSMIKKNAIFFKGRENLFKRPLDPYFKIFKQMRIDYKFSLNNTEQLFLDGKLKSGKYKIAGNVSSQFITGLLFSLVHTEGDSIIEIDGNLESKSYIDLTLDCLKNFKIKIKNENYQKLYISGHQKYQKIESLQEIVIESDFSQAAFFLVANELNSEIVINNLNKNSLQGDKKIIELINKVKNFKENDEVLIIDGSNCPDIIPIFSLYAAFSNKKIKINNIERLRIKECDRLAVTVSELSKLGFDLIELKDSILINHKFKTQLKNKTVFLSAHNDHRIAMMIAIASTVYEGDIILEDYLSVKKSYPNFWEVFFSLGGKFNECLGK